MLNIYRLSLLALVSAVILLPKGLAGQEGLDQFKGKKVKQIKNRFDNGDKETYYVFEEDRETLHGPYEVIISCGNGIRGQYENGKPTGKWTFANHDGIFQEYDFDQEAFLFRGFEETPGDYVHPIGIESFDTSLLILEPTIIGGRDRLQHLLQYAAVIPRSMTLPEDPSFCKYRLLIDEKGRFDGFEISHAPAAPFVEICKKAIESVRGLRYFPMVYDGKPVASAIEITIYFPGEQFRNEGYTIPDNRIHPLIR